MLGILVAGIASLLFVHAPNWLIILLAVMLTTAFLLFCASFIYFMRIEPGALRSEDYSLAKHAMDKGLFTAQMVRQVRTRELAIRNGQNLEIENARELSLGAPRKRKRSEPASHGQEIS